MDKKKVEEENPIVVPELPASEPVEKSNIEKSVEDSKENVAKGYEEVEVEPKEVVNIVVEAKDPKKGPHKEADIKDVYTHPNANIEHKIVYETEEQKQADIK